ncbi:hypothetical protein [Sorangium sp. So ce124]|uniref:hypothetical protein n=1 Tax=Sorangium sp. So ce124 TaxID=3133280 RepID=UPI003F60231E
MKKVMTIHDVWEFSHVDGVVAAGTNADFDAMDRRRVEALLCGREVVVILASGAVARLIPAGVHVSESIVGKKNILLTMPRFISKTDLVVGSDVCMVDEGG